MDKYEFNIKVEQIRKMSAKGDYETAMKIADGIDWRRVRNANLLSSVAEIYEQNQEYEEAKDILLLAFERAPVGKRLLYKLSEISVKAGDIQDAEEFYRDFSEMSPDDSRQYLLRYMILKAKGAPAEQLINSLEQYAASDVDEKWLYELAQLYAKAGRDEDCVYTCDQIMLLFGLGKYVDKAMELKQQYAPLTKQQMDLVENRDKYEEKLKRVEERYGDEEGEYYDDDDASSYGQRGTSGEAMAETAAETDFAAGEAYAASGEDSPAAAAVSGGAEEQSGHMPEVPVHISNRQYGRAVEESIAHAKEQARELVTQAVNEQRAAQQAEAGQKPVIQEDEQVQYENPASQVEEDVIDGDIEEERPYHMIIEARSREEGLNIAIDELKYYHEQYGISNKVAKTNAEKLNQKGFSVFIPKLAGKDLIVEDAGALKLEVIDEIAAYIDGLSQLASVVLVDVIDHFDALAEARPAFIEKFDIVSDADDAEDDEDLFEDVDLEQQRGAQTVPEEPAAPVSASAAPSGTQEVVYQAEAQPSAGGQDAEAQVCEDGSGAPEDGYAEEAYDGSDEAGDYEDEAYEDASYEDEDYEDGEAYDEEDGYEEDAEYADQAPASGEQLPADYYDEMDIDDFANYAQQYARQIDCVLPGKTVLALYERIELMEEDEVPLTKESAEALIEEAADKAEKPSIAKRITGMFNSKYDREGHLILREEHFV